MFERLKEMLGYKDCPECGEPLEITYSTFRKYFKCENCGYHGTSSNSKRRNNALQESAIKIIVVVAGILLGLFTLQNLLD